jgi:hypothetical protein
MVSLYGFWREAQSDSLFALFYQGKMRDWAISSS